jgi:hypothetical protein
MSQKYRRRNTECNTKKKYIERGSGVDQKTNFVGVFWEL